MVEWGTTAPWRRDVSLLQDACGLRCLLSARSPAAFLLSSFTLAKLPCLLLWLWVLFGLEQKMKDLVRKHWPLEK